MNADTLAELFAAWRSIPRLPGALCVTDPQAFDDTNDPAAIDYAISICQSCPALADCREYASQYEGRELSGVVAGELRSWTPQRVRRGSAA